MSDPREISCVNGNLRTREVSCAVVPCVKLMLYLRCMGRAKPIIANEYIVGLTDGEGCFHVNMGKYPAYKSGIRVQMHFYIKMQEKDRPLLEKIKNTLQCGEVYFQKEKRVNHCQCYRYTVSSQKEILNNIIPFFTKYPLQSVTKQKSFEAFCKIANLVKKGEHLNKNGIRKIQLLKSRMNKKIIGLA